jgi:hypothetical protein
MLFFWRNSKNKKRYMRPEDYRQALIDSTVKLVMLFILHVIIIRYSEMTDSTVFTAWWDSIWLTWATFTTVGYGDISSAVIIGRIATMVLGTLGIVQFAGIAGNLFDYRSYKRELQNTHRWEWRDMTNHILVVGLPNEGSVRYIENFIKEVRGYPEFASTEIQFMAPNVPDRENLPAIAKTDDAQVVFYRGSGSEEADLKAANVEDACLVLVLCADPHEHDADDVTAAVVYRITEEFNVTVPVIAEASYDRRIPFIKKNGASSVVRATNDYPGIIIKEALAPGSYVIVSDLFGATGNELNDYNVKIDGVSWVDALCKAGHAGWMFMGYSDVDGNVFKFGSTDVLKNATRVFLSMPQGNQPTHAEVQRVLASD